MLTSKHVTAWHAFLGAYSCVKPALMEKDPRYACFCFVGGPDDVLSKVLTTMVEPEALLPALMMMSNPFQSATSLNSKQAEAQTSDFKARLLQIYFSTPAPPGLQLPQPQAHQKKCHCMVSRLRLKSKLIEAAHIWPKASAQARTSFDFN